MKEVWQVLKTGDIRVLLVLLAIAQLVWGTALIGFYNPVTMAFASVWALGQQIGYALLHLVLAYCLLVCVWQHMPPPLVSLLGVLTTLLWTWELLARLFLTTPITIGLITPLEATALGLLMVYRAARRAADPIIPSAHPLTQTTSC